MELLTRVLNRGKVWSIDRGGEKGVRGRGGGGRGGCSSALGGIGDTFGCYVSGESSTTLYIFASRFSCRPIIIFIPPC